MTLPTELLQKIANVTCAPISNLVSLKLVARSIYLKLPSPPSGYLGIASDCEKRAVRRYVTKRNHILGGRRTCIICDGLMLLDIYYSGTEPVFKWHLSRFKRDHDIKGVPETGNMGTMIVPRPTTTVCGHCKKTRDIQLDGCACNPENECESCGTWEM